MREFEAGILVSEIDRLVNDSRRTLAGAGGGLSGGQR
jgi:hypothetical protein